MILAFFYQLWDNEAKALTVKKYSFFGRMTRNMTRFF